MECARLGAALDTTGYCLSKLISRGRVLVRSQKQEIHDPLGIGVCLYMEHMFCAYGTCPKQRRVARTSKNPCISFPPRNQVRCVLQEKGFTYAVLMIYGSIERELRWYLRSRRVCRSTLCFRRTESLVCGCQPNLSYLMNVDKILHRCRFGP
jgi:hypothetical protein